MEIDAQETIQQLGGKGLTGALVYTGTSKIYRLPTKAAMWFKVNGRRGYQTYIEVKLMPSDTYTLTLLSHRGKAPNVTHDTREDVYCEELQSTFEAMYDEHMNTKNNGFIPV